MSPLKTQIEAIQREFEDIKFKTYLRVDKNAEDIANNLVQEYKKVINSFLTEKTKEAVRTALAECRPEEKRSFTFNSDNTWNRGEKSIGYNQALKDYDTKTDAYLEGI